MTRLEAIKKQLQEQSPYYAYMTETTRQAHDDIIVLLAVVDAAQESTRTHMKKSRGFKDDCNCRTCSALAVLNKEKEE
jgi:50S ribosomal subunit-associated GTPase HflX